MRVGLFVPKRKILDSLDSVSFLEFLYFALEDQKVLETVDVFLEALSDLEIHGVREVFVIEFSHHKECIQQLHQMHLDLGCQGSLNHFLELFESVLDEDCGFFLGVALEIGVGEDFRVDALLGEGFAHLEDGVFDVGVLLLDLVVEVVPGLTAQPLLEDNQIHLRLQLPSELPQTLLQPQLYLPPLLQEPLVDEVDPREPLDSLKLLAHLLRLPHSLAHQVDESSILFHQVLHTQGAGDLGGGLSLASDFHRGHPCDGL